MVEPSNRSASSSVLSPLSNDDLDVDCLIFFFLTTFLTLFPASSSSTSRKTPFFLRTAFFFFFLEEEDEEYDIVFIVRTGGAVMWRFCLQILYARPIVNALPPWSWCNEACSDPGTLSLSLSLSLFLELSLSLSLNRVRGKGTWIRPSWFTVPIKRRIDRRDDFGISRARSNIVPSFSSLSL